MYLFSLPYSLSVERTPQLRALKSRSQSEDPVVKRVSVSSLTIASFRIVLLMGCVLAQPIRAQAGVTEVRRDFLNLSSLLPPSAIMAAPPSDGSYLICVTAGDVEKAAPTTILRWTDENGEFRNFAYPQLNGVPGGCNLIRNQGGTAATIETDGTYSGYYNLFAFGLGFWPGGGQSQAGLKEALNYAVVGLNGGHEFSFPGFPWLFAVIANSNCHWQLSAGSAGTVTKWGSQVSTSYGAGNGVFTTLTGSCSYSLVALQFGSPKAGTGPLTDYEYNLLDWTNATYPKLETAFTGGSNGANILLAINIAEQPNNGIVNEGLLATWSNSTAEACAAALLGEPSGQPSSYVSSAFVAPLSRLQFFTYNTPGQEWGSSPTYNAEVDVIQF